jgi:peptide/nickel transport system substrate-binding protein
MMLSRLSISRRNGWGKLPSVLSLSPAVLALALLTGCANRQDPSPGSTGSSQTSAPLELRIAHPDQPRRLDPAHSKDLFEGIASGLLYDGLVGYDSANGLEPRLAESFSSNDDFSSFQFKLRRNARFHDERPVTSADVRYSFERVLRPETGSDRRWVLNRIEGADLLTSGITRSLDGLLTPDDHTVIIKLSHPGPVFLRLLAMPAASIIPAGSADNTPAAAGSMTPLDTQPIGTGPWKLVNWQRDRRLVFERHTDSWGPAPKFDKLLWQVIADDAVRRTAFQQGQVDIHEVGFQEWDRYQQDPALKAQLLPNQELRTDFLGFGCARPGISNPQVRRALRLALDTNILFERIQKGRGVPATGPVPPLPGWTPPTAVPPDPTQARTLLKEAGYDESNPLKVTLWYRELSLNSEIVAAVREAWQSVGVKVETMPRDQAAFRAAIWAGQPDVFLGSWTLDYPDPENALVPPFHSRNIPRQGNQAHFADDTTDDLLDDARDTLDPADRIRKFRQAEAHVNDLTPWIPLFHRRTYHTTGPRITGWKPKLMYNADRFLDAIPAP